MQRKEVEGTTVGRKGNRNLGRRAPIHIFVHNTVRCIDTYFGGDTPPALLHLAEM